MSGTVDESPSFAGEAATALFAGVAVLATTPVPTATVAVFGGAVGAVAGVRRGSRWLVTAGTVLAFAGVLLAAVAGAPVALVLVGAGATLVAFDAGSNAVRLGRQVGGAAGTARTEAVHVAASALFATVVGAVAYAAFRVARGQRPAASVALLIAAVLAFGWLQDR